MILNYLKLSFRLMARNAFFTFINVTGLSLGFAVFFMLWQHSQNELKSDQFHKDYNQIYRLTTFAEWTDDKVNWQGSIGGGTGVTMIDIVARNTEVIDFTAIYPRMAQAVHGVDHAAEISLSYEPLPGNRISFEETAVVYAEPNFFEFFSFPVINGNGASCLTAPQSVVVSQKTATKYFGTDDPIGKTLYLNRKIGLTVTGVFKDLPHNTHFVFDVVISANRIRNYINSKPDFSCIAYCKIPPDTDVNAVAEKVNKTSSAEVNAAIWGAWAGGRAQLRLQPLTAIAFEALRFDLHESRSRYLLQLFSVAAIVILVMAWINQINLTISAGAKRMKELAARKTVGARQSDFLLQFLVEALLINLLSALLALTWTQLLRTPARELLQFYVPSWTEIPLATHVTMGCIVMGGVLLTGSYLAIVSLNRSPRRLNQLNTTAQASRTNGILTIVQFAATCTLLIWVFTVHNQVSFVLRKDMGLKRDEVVVMDLPVVPTEHFRDDVEKFAHDAAMLPGVKALTTSTSVLAQVGIISPSIGLHRNEGDFGVRVEINGGVDETFIPFYGIKLLAGRNFLPGNPANSNSILISRGTMVRLGIQEPEKALGEKLHSPPCEIIGVFEDYNNRPFLYSEDNITYGGKPGLALTYKDSLVPYLQPRKISLLMEPNDFEKTISQLDKIYHANFPGDYFSWSFLDDQINNQYQSERTARNQMLFFSALATIIACLGLLGITTNKLANKLKEIGIRKVLGAKAHQVGHVLLHGTLKQIGVATIIGLPASYYLSNMYLVKFTEQIALQWWHYAIPVALLLLIMFVTIAGVLLKAARTNPVESLRSE